MRVCVYAACQQRQGQQRQAQRGRAGRPEPAWKARRTYGPHHRLALLHKLAADVDVARPRPHAHTCAAAAGGGSRVGAQGRRGPPAPSLPHTCQTAHTRAASQHTLSHPSTTSTPPPPPPSTPARSAPPPTRDEAPLHQLVRLVAHNLAVLARPRFRLIPIHHQVRGAAVGDLQRGRRCGCPGRGWMPEGRPSQAPDAGHEATARTWP